MKDIHRVLITGTGRWFVQETPGGDVNCQYGLVRGSEIDVAKDGDIVQTNSGEKLVVYTPSFIDKYKKIQREAQIITFKDAGVIITTAGLGPQSVVLEAGSGSGALTVLLSTYCKHVFSYEIKDEHLAVAKENVSWLGNDNVTFRKHDISQGIPDTELDAMILDMPEPWIAFTHIPSAIKVGGYVITYVPSAMQLKRVHDAANEIGLLHVRSTEVSERHWMVKEQAVRPTSKNVAFTAFLSFFRWMGPNWPHLRPKDKQPTPLWTMPEEDIMQEVFD